jgi:hypothetical protein
MVSKSTGIFHGTARFMVFPSNSTGTGTTLEASLSTEDPTLLLFHKLAQADHWMINTASCLLVDGVLHAL